jgi:hypothetical protein
MITGAAMTLERLQGRYDRCIIVCGTGGDSLERKCKRRGRNYIENWKITERRSRPQLDAIHI